MKPDPAALEFVGRVACLAAMADAICVRLNLNPADFSRAMSGVTSLVDASSTGVAISAKAAPPLDLAKIDFAALAGRFKDRSSRTPG